MSNDTKMVDSASDERTINNVMRHQYRVLSDAERAQMQAIKDKGLELYTMLHHIGGTNPEMPYLATRELSIAATKIEEAVMWGVKHVTG